MKMYFHGSLVELTLFLRELGHYSKWAAQPNGVWMMRRPDGVNIHWAETTNRLWCSGRPRTRAVIESDIAERLRISALDQNIVSSRSQ